MFECFECLSRECLNREKRKCVKKIKKMILKKMNMLVWRERKLNMGLLNNPCATDRPCKFLSSL